MFILTAVFTGLYCSTTPWQMHCHEKMINSLLQKIIKYQLQVKQANKFHKNQHITLFLLAETT